jgi:hypothetical protein
MLLLLLTDVYEPITLDNLFHISTGLLEDKHERFIEHNNDQRKVWFLHMGDMRANDGLIDFENLAQNESDLINNRLKRGKKKIASKKDTNNDSIDLIPITEKRLIQSTDYLLCVRGVPAGYSMIKSMNELKKYKRFENFCAVATHHFIIFKLRDNYSNMNIHYIHLILDSIVKNELLDLYNNKKNGLVSKNSNKLATSNNNQGVIITGIKEIKDIKAKVFKRLEKQDEIVSFHNEIVDATKKIEEKSLQYNNSINLNFNSK